MHVVFIEPASIELDDAIEYYNLQSPGLGKKFLEEVLDRETINYFIKTNFRDLKFFSDSTEQR